MTRAQLTRPFGIPAALSILSVLGLCSALFGDGIWDVLSWVSLGALPVVIVAKVTRDQSRRGRHDELTA